jgi:hypothetical protein
MGKRTFVATMRPVAPALEGLAEDLLGHPARVHVRRVDEVHAGVEAEVELAPGAGHVDVPDAGEVPLPSEAHGPEGEGGDPQARASQLAEVHERSSFLQEARP